MICRSDHRTIPDCIDKETVTSLYLFYGYRLAIQQIIRIFENKTRVMTTKLTLTVDKEVIEQAKSYARQTGRSLSELIEQYLENITRENRSQEVSPGLQKLIGAVRLPPDFDEKKELQEYLRKKHA
jgi:macrodomain Ter protein organizer (MatP/YcbG family)